MFEEFVSNKSADIVLGRNIIFLKLIENMNAEGKVKEIKLNYDKKDLFGRK